MKWFDVRSAGQVFGGWVLALVLIMLIGASGVLRDDRVADPQTTFTIASFAADYHLRTDADGTVGMDVVETIDADFSSADPHHGITRTLPIEDEGIDLGLAVHGIRDGAGQGLDWTETSDGGQRQIQVNDPQASTAATRTYVIEYSLDHVVRDAGERMRFQWDVAGDGWSQTMERASVAVRMDEQVASRLDGSLHCREGAVDAMESCDLTRSDVGDETTLTAESPNAVSPGDTFTIDVGFTADSFTAPSLSAITIINRVVPAVITLGLLGAAATLLVLGITRRRRWVAGHPLVAEFQPRPDLPPVVASVYYGRPDRGISAELLAAAQRGEVVLRDTPAGLEAQRVQPTAPDPALSAASVGLFFTREQHSRRLLSEKPAKGPANLLANTFRTWLRGRRTPFRYPPDILRGKPVPHLAVVVLPVVVILTLQRGALEEWALIAGVVTIACLAVLAGCLSAFVELKEEHRDEFVHLEGLRWFISLSEAERMRVVQGAETAQRFGPEDQIKIYDRLLPYAVAFGLETTWQAEMADKIATLGGLQPGVVPDAVTRTRQSARRNSSVRSAGTGHHKGGWFGGILG